MFLRWLQMGNVRDCLMRTAARRTVVVRAKCTRSGRRQSDVHCARMMYSDFKRLNAHPCSLIRLAGGREGRTKAASSCRAGGSSRYRRLSTSARWPYVTRMKSTLPGAPDELKNSTAPSRLGSACASAKHRHGSSQTVSASAIYRS
jgi:hypothetical protein